MYTCLHPHVSLRKYTVLSHKCMNTVCLYAQYGKIIGNIIDYICMFYLHKYDQICIYIYRMNVYIYIIKLYIGIGIMMYLTCTDIYIHTITYIYTFTQCIALLLLGSNNFGTGRSSQVTTQLFYNSSGLCSRKCCGTQVHA